MCELFGISSAEKVLCNDLLKLFYSNSVNHPDGWGLATFYENSVSIEKEPVCAVMSRYLEARLTDTIEEDILMAHIRKASSGGLSYNNSHPFSKRDVTGRLWTLEHNGTIFSCDELEKYREIQKGQCDSERILLFLIDLINERTTVKGCMLSDEERAETVDQAMSILSPNNKVNILLFDGRFFYVHTNHPESLYSLRRGPALIFSTRPLDEDKWEHVPMNTLLAFKREQLVYTGTEHQYTYLKDDEKDKVFDPFTSPDIYYI